METQLYNEILKNFEMEDSFSNLGLSSLCFALVKNKNGAMLPIPISNAISKQEFDLKKAFNIRAKFVYDEQSDQVLLYFFNQEDYYVESQKIDGYSKLTNADQKLEAAFDKAYQKFMN